MTTTEPKAGENLLPSLQHLLFEAPLYATFKLPEGKWWKGDNLEGHCPECKRESIFKTVWKVDVYNHLRPYQQPFNSEVVCRCVRKDQHIICFQLRLHMDTVQKFGQFPSFASVSEGSLKKFRGILDSRDVSELNRATRLAAHGVGIGSFVYVRRIFERLIQKRFDEFKDREGWQEDEFKALRMDERIHLMRDHLPDFMVASKKLYGILSRGIHTLAEQECLDFFGVARTAIIFILDEDQRKKEEFAERQEAQKAIAQFPT